MINDPHIYSAGAQARLNGVQHWENPYSFGADIDVPLHTLGGQWLLGWVDADKRLLLDEVFEKNN